MFKSYCRCQIKIKGARDRDPVPRLRLKRKFGKSGARDLYQAAAGLYEQDLDAPPVADDVRYRPKMETQTRALKVIFMACVSEEKEIGLWEMRKEGWVNCTTKSGKAYTK